MPRIVTTTSQHYLHVAFSVQDWPETLKTWQMSTSSIQSLSYKAQGYRTHEDKDDDVKSYKREEVSFEKMGKEEELNLELLTQQSYYGWIHFLGSLYSQCDNGSAYLVTKGLLMGKPNCFGWSVRTSISTLSLLWINGRFCSKYNKHLIDHGTLMIRTINLEASLIKEH
jgi:hypothetical protein